MPTIAYDTSGYHLNDTAGYHLNNIPRGKFGDLSKMIEEMSEIVDADEQKVSIMVLVEMSDLYGAMEGYLAKHHPGTTMDDIKAFSAVTQRAFRNGHRTPS